MTTDRFTENLSGYTTEELAFIERLKRSIAFKPAQMAIVDLTYPKEEGRPWLYQDDDGKTKPITLKSPISVRFEARSMAHVRVYGFRAIAMNRLEACD
ncbi:hypothetical protein RDJLphi1_gp65 [Roseobacter phage RDJL Phi 1]|uniref:Uncharacterized protein n=1 Tax=Roseobacter phage RDJL Phi 1 TaxID=562742 RepID=F4YXS6_9CAUD|nr:hypothetical protein RDJLphi1_gp65 [Roseobacter phage RDJL Phi 1]ADK73466.1 hypothetical protein RDJLphi1_gp65 [Roseobacter phage RDJL Phi 1]